MLKNFMLSLIAISAIILILGLFFGILFDVLTYPTTWLIWIALISVMTIVLTLFDKLEDK